MTTVLMCNVGSQDLRAPNEVLPEKFQYHSDTPKQNQRFSERERATWLAEHFEKIKQHLMLPIIDKAIDYIGAQQIDLLVLIGSDQDDDHYRATDTIKTAEVMRDLLLERGFRLPQLQVWPLRDPRNDRSVSPADVDAVLRCLELLLARFEHEFQPKQVFLEVTGGTPAMSNALLLAGTEVFQARAAALYISRTSSMPQRLAVGQRLLAAPIREVLRSNITTYQYSAAEITWQRFEPYFTDQASAGTASLIAALIKHAAARLNLDLDAARAAIKGLDALAGGQYRSLIEPLYNDLVPRTREKELAEVLQVARVRFENAVYTDFLSQVVRFLENMLRLVCLRNGVQFINWKHQPDENGARVDKVWADKHGLGKVPIGQNGLQQVLRKLVVQDPLAQVVLDAASRLENLIRLRNEATHSLKGISASDLSDAFGEDYRQVLPFVEQLYAHVVAKPLALNPYQQINQMLLELLVQA